MTSERRLMIDLLAARQEYSRLEISDIGLVRTHYNPPDPFKKIGRYDALERIVSNPTIAQYGWSFFRKQLGRGACQLTSTMATRHNLRDAGRGRVSFNWIHQLPRVEMAKSQLCD